jgi:hypothetical protein
MAEIAIYLIIALLTIVIPYLGIINISRIEEEDSYKTSLVASSKDRVFTLLAGIIGASAAIYQDTRMRLTEGLPEKYYISFIVSTAIILGYLIFMSYTDQKIKLLYTTVSLIVMILMLISFIINWNTVKNYFINEYTWTVIIVILVLGIMSIFRYIGFGDVIIYVVLSIYLISYRNVPLVSILVNIVIANTLFIINALIAKIIRKDQEKHQPLTMFIALATLLCGIMFI